jgi:hypothetical protein
MAKTFELIMGSSLTPVSPRALADFQSDGPIGEAPRWPIVVKLHC